MTSHLRFAGFPNVPFPLAIVASAVLSTASVAAVAAEPGEPPSTAKDLLPPYEQLGVNSDGIVTLPEVEVHNPSLARRIAHCDANGDRKLSRDEYRRCKPFVAKKTHS